MNRDNPKRRLRRARAALDSATRIAGSYHTVSLPRQLAMEIRREIRERFGGDLSKAAKASGISAATLRRLATGRAKRITTWTLRGLHILLTSDGSRWGSFIYDGESLLRIRDYHEWQTVTSSYLSGKLDFAAFEHWHRRYDHNPLRAERLRVLDRVARVCPDVVTGLLALSQSGRYFTGRLETAILRMIDPLCQAILSGRVEKSQEEMGDDEFRLFVEAGFDRELILLDRVPDISRIQDPFYETPTEVYETTGISKALRSLIGEGE